MVFDSNFIDITAERIAINDYFATRFFVRRLERSFCSLNRPVLRGSPFKRYPLIYRPARFVFLLFIYLYFFCLSPFESVTVGRVPTVAMQTFRPVSVPAARRAGNVLSGHNNADLRVNTRCYDVLESGIRGAESRTIVVGIIIVRCSMKPRLFKGHDEDASEHSSCNRVYSRYGQRKKKITSCKISSVDTSGRYTDSAEDIFRSA